MSDTLEHLTGEWTIHQIGDHHRALMSAIQAGAWTLDASGITEFDSAGLQLLVAARHTLLRQGRELQLVAASACVRDALANYGLDASLHPVHAEPQS